MRDEARAAVEQLLDAAGAMRFAANHLWWAQNPDEHDFGGQAPTEESAKNFHTEAWSALQHAEHYAAKELAREGEAIPVAPGDAGRLFYVSYGPGFGKDGCYSVIAADGLQSAAEVASRAIGAERVNVFLDMGATAVMMELKNGAVAYLYRESRFAPLIGKGGLLRTPLTAPAAHGSAEATCLQRDAGEDQDA